MTVQLFGDYACLHPHLHALVTDNLFLETGFFFIPKVNLQPLTDLFRVHVLKRLKKEELLEDTFIKMMLKLRHTLGFGGHNEVRIKPDDDKGRERSQYIIRNTLKSAKLLERTVAKG